jgi:hypothetical protein
MSAYTDKIKIFQSLPPLTYNQQKRSTFAGYIILPVIN